MNKRTIKGFALMLVVGLMAACSSESGKNEVSLEGNDFLVTIKNGLGRNESHFV